MIFSYAAVWSAGVGRDAAQWETRNADFLGKAEQVNKSLKLFNVSIGDKDGGLNSAKSLSEILTKHGIKNELHISSGGHTWINWRHYLNELLPKMQFADDAK
jgi:enterochelin esterase family protein